MAAEEIALVLMTAIVDAAELVDSATLVATVVEIGVDVTTEIAEVETGVAVEVVVSDPRSIWSANVAFMTALP